MTITEYASKQLSAVALFGELYTQRREIYDIVCLFLNTVIVKDDLRTFTIQQLQKSLQDNYNFSIPEAVIETVLRAKMGTYVSKISGSYTVTTKPTDKIIDPQRKKSIEDAYQKIIDELLAFVADYKHKDFSDAEKRAICDAFLNYFIVGPTVDYTNLIAGFIVKFENTDEFVQMLNTLKEGATIYSGLVFSPETFNTIGQWKRDLTIFLDTEILFHFAGYNGTTYENMFNEFMQLVEKINTLEDSTARISLKYFKVTKDEIDTFFARATDYVEKGARDIKLTTAMNAILGKCNNREAIAIEQAKFYTLLEKNGITEDTVVEYCTVSDDITKYILEYIPLGVGVTKQFEMDMLRNWAFLNNISIIREGTVAIAIDDVGSIFVTDTKIVTGMSRAITSAKCHLPFAISLSAITCKLWLKLNRGFGGHNVPTSFDAIKNAQIILAGHFNKSIYGRYSSLMKEVVDNELSKEQADKLLCKFREALKPPEDIGDDDVVDILDIITSDEVSAMQQLIVNQALEITQLNVKNTELKQKSEELAGEVQDKNTIISKYKCKEELREKKQKRIRKGLRICAIVFTILLVIILSYWLIVHHEYLTTIGIGLGIIVAVIMILKEVKAITLKIKNVKR